MKISDCQHVPKVPAKPQADYCQAEEKTNSQRFDLRVCLTCGFVGCCEDDPGQHSKKHVEETGHPVIASCPVDQSSFIWCYIDNDYLQK